MDNVVVNAKGDVTKGKYNCIGAGEQLTTSIQRLQKATIVMDRRFCGEEKKDKNDMVDDFGNKMKGNELGDAQDASVQKCLNHIDTLFTQSKTAISSINTFLTKFRKFGLLGRIITVITRVIGSVVKAIDKVKTTYKNAIDKINPKFQKVCKFGNKLRKPIGTLFSALAQFNCGIKKYGYCGCPNFMVNTIMSPTTVINDWADDLIGLTSWLGDPTDANRVSIIDQMYDIVCNPDNALIIAWEEIKGIVWDVIYEDIVGPILTLMDKVFCIRFFGIEYCTSISKILEAAAKTLGLVMDAIMAPLTPLVNSLISIFLDPIEDGIEALVAKVSPDFPFPTSILTGHLNFPDFKLPDALTSSLAKFETPVYAAFQETVRIYL